MAGIGGVVPYPRGDGLTAATPRRLVSVRPEEADQLGVHDLRYLFVGVVADAGDQEDLPQSAGGWAGGD